MPAYEPKKTYNSGGSSNNFYGPPSQGIDYNQQVQKSNEQFREKMNREAREWNDYARQKANRGW